MDHEVGTQGPVGETHLLGEVAPLDQPGQLDRAAQVQLAPAAADLRLAQGRGERLGLAAQGLARHPHVEHLLVELPLPAGALVVEVLELVAEPVEPLHDLGLVDHAVADGLDVGRAGPHPQHPEEPAESEAERETGEQQHDVHAADHGGDHRQSPGGGLYSRSTTTGAWSEAPSPARSSRSTKPCTTRAARDGEPRTKSMRMPRLRSKRWR